MLTGNFSESVLELHLMEGYEILRKRTSLILIFVGLFVFVSFYTLQTLYKKKEINKQKKQSTTSALTIIRCQITNLS